MSIGTRIRLARKRLGLSLDDVAGRMGAITKQALSKYETDKTIPDSRRLMQLGSALDVTIDYFLRPTTVRLESVSFRKLTSLAAEERDRIEFYVLDRLERQLELERIVFGEQCPVYEGMRGLVVGDVDEAERAAERCRLELGLGTDPVSNIAAALETWCVRVLQTPAPMRGLDGFCHWVTNDVPVIVISGDPNVPGDRQRMTLAHELGHLTMHCASGVNEENAAKRFAGAFLAPKEALVRELGAKRFNLDWTELLKLKHLYGISMSALLFRAEQCGIISLVRRAHMHKEMGTRGWAQHEPGPQVPRERIDLGVLDRLVDRALSEGLISFGRAAELQAMSTADYRAARGEATGVYSS